jgi:hypothetical protein
VLLEALYRKIPELHAEKRAALGHLWLERNRDALELRNRWIAASGG